MYLGRSQTLNKDASVTVLKVESSWQLIQVALKMTQDSGKTTITNEYFHPADMTDAECSLAN